MKPKAVGIMSPGEMGHEVGRVLVHHGMPVFAAVADRSERTQGLAKAAGIATMASVGELLGRVDLLLSIMVPAQALAAAKTVAGVLSGANCSLTYVECNAIAPSTARAAAAAISDAGGTFVDVGIIGPPPTRDGVTRFYASGAETTAFQELSDFGLDIRVVGDQIGQASGLKICYAALTKGFFALSMELLSAARRMGLYEHLVGEFELSQQPRYRSMQEQVPRVVPKVGRWVGEMEEIATTFAELGLTPFIHQGAADVYRRVERTELARETVEDRKDRSLAELIEIIAATGGGRT